jgi:hypothetical protein
MAGKTRKNPSKNGATLGFEAQLWAAADKMRALQARKLEQHYEP